MNEVNTVAGPAAPATTGAWRRRAGRLVAWCSWLYLALVVLVWALLHAADLWGPATLLMFGPRWLLLLPLAPLALTAAALRRRSLGPVLLSLALVAGPVMGLCVPWQRLWPAPAGPRLRLLTCNMHYRNPDPLALHQLLLDTRPDIVLLQEWPGPGWLNHFAGADWHVRRESGSFVASRFPIRRADLLGHYSMTRRGLVHRCELDTPAGTATVFSVHFASPRKGLQDMTQEASRGLAELEAGSELRWRQSEGLAEDAGRVAGPLLLAGDFNTPPESALFRRVWGQYTDAFGAVGWGWGYTFFAGKNAVRIDHILAGPGWHCERCWVGPAVGSPHHPVIADLVWSPADVGR